MTTSISPALGHAVWTQQGTGTTPGYDAIDVRRLMSDPYPGEGVPTYGTYRVSQRGAGANMSVDINMDDFAYIRGDAVSFQGIYKIAPHSATINEAISTADATNPRIDRVVLEVKDTTHDASGSSLAQTRVITGTPTGGATLDNLTGAATVPSSALLLADVLVAATDTSITDSEIRDRRSFVAGVPPIVTDVDEVVLEFVGQAMQVIDMASGTDNRQAAALVRCGRRIAGATRIRWHYRQGATAWTGSYNIGIYDASGRKIVETGAVSATGAANSHQVRSETITATTFEPGLYYAAMGLVAPTPGQSATTTGLSMGFVSGNSPVGAPNTGLRSTTGGTTMPTTILSFGDIEALTSDTGSNEVPLLTLTVG